MLTFKFEFAYAEEIREWQVMYSHVFRRMYSNLDLLTSTKADRSDAYRGEFDDALFARNPLLDKSLYEIILTDAKETFDLHEAGREMVRKDLATIEKEILELETKTRRLTPKQSRKLYKLRRKRDRKLKSLTKGNTFGGKRLLREITHAAQMAASCDDEEQAREYSDRYEEKLAEFRENRVLPYKFVGRANEGGNRKFDFRFNENLIVFKPKSGVKINLRIKPTKSQLKVLLKIQKLVDEKAIPLTCSVTTNSVMITFDNKLVNGFAYDVKSYNKAVKNMNESEKEEYKALRRKEYQERLKADKVDGRVCSIDMNPEYIGAAIVDKAGRIIATKLYDFRRLHREIKRRGDNNTDKLKYMISIAYRDLFRMCKHYGVEYFVCEKLEFEESTDQTRKFNRLVNQLWCRAFQVQLITKYTENLGIRISNPYHAYSSFVGNLLFEHTFDPVAAALELARRHIRMKNNRTGDDLVVRFLDAKYRPIASEGEANPSIRALFKLVLSRNKRYRNRFGISKPGIKGILLQVNTLSNLHSVSHIPFCD